MRNLESKSCFNLKFKNFTISFSQTIQTRSHVTHKSSPFSKIRWWTRNKRWNSPETTRRTEKKVSSTIFLSPARSSIKNAKVSFSRRVSHFSLEIKLHYYYEFFSSPSSRSVFTSLQVLGEGMERVLTCVFLSLCSRGKLFLLFLAVSNFSGNESEHKLPHLPRRIKKNAWSSATSQNG